MCGFIFAIGASSVENFIKDAHNIQKHRGPDDEGLVFEQAGQTHLGFAHQRLSILDLSDLGHQPMESASGQHIIVFNGEIYNYRQLAQEFDLSGLKSGSDTEVALELIEKIGIEKACQKFNGMWALAIYDRKAGQVYVARDRFGKKPLNYRLQDDTIYMASEVKSLFAIPDFYPTPNIAVAARFLSQHLQNVDNDSWIEGITALPPASMGVIDVHHPQEGIQHIQRYWHADLTENAADSDDVQITDLRRLVEDATEARLHADVSVGIALSGGLDSSILAALSRRMQAKVGQEAVLFSVSHPGNKDDETEFIDIMAKHLQCDVHKFSLELGSGPEIYDLIAHCSHMNDGPVSSMSAVLFHQLMEKAKTLGIKVVLTGQGADEGFCGYRKYPALEIKRQLRAFDIMGAARFLGGYLKQGTMVSEFNFAEAKRYLGASNTNILGEAAQKALSKISLTNFDGTIAKRQLLDIEQYSVPYLCHYEDRMSMAHSREVRAPFLDYRVVQKGLSMPTSMKMRSGWTKYALRQAFSDILPPEITWRKDKKGFVSPEGDWFRGGLKSRVLDLMEDADNPVYTLGLVDRTAYLALYKRYCDGDRRIWLRDVFAPFSLALWLETLPKRAH